MTTNTQRYRLIPDCIGGTRAEDRTWSERTCSGRVQTIKGRNICWWHRYNLRSPLREIAQRAAGTSK